MDSIMAFIEEQPKWWLASVGFLIIIILWAVSTDNWTPQVQSIILGAGAILVLTGIGDKESEIISLDEANRVALDYMHKKQVNNIIESGGLSSTADSKLQEYEGQPHEYVCGVKLDSGENPVFVVTIKPYRNRRGKVVITGCTRRPSWSTDDKPNVEVVVPPDIMTYIKYKRELGAREEK